MRNMRKYKLINLLNGLIYNIKLIPEGLFLNIINFRYIKYNKRVKNILQLNIDNTLKNCLGERDLPGDEKFRKNNWWRVMLLRYGLAMYYSKGKCVIDTCSGLSWGSYLLEGVTTGVTCLDIDKKCVSIAKGIWKNNVDYVCASVLEMPIYSDTFDVATAMESIEHFPKDDIEKYLAEIYRVLKPNGILIGSSSFPDTVEEAQQLCMRNNYHKHVCTKEEIESILRNTGFINIKIYQNRLFFIAKKPC